MDSESGIQIGLTAIHPQTGHVLALIGEEIMRKAHSTGSHKRKDSPVQQ